MQLSTTLFRAFQCLCLYFFSLLIFSPNVAFSGSVVKYLPGFDGELPFNLQTGYISVDDLELFYYFIESQGNPKEDPFLLWLIGGPGCSSFNGMIYEIGPVEFDIENYSGGLPSLRYYPYPWTKTASILFLDSPVGTDFSYSKTPEGWSSSDSKASRQVYQFLRKWLDEHPQYLPNQLFIGGDSYSGIIVPVVVKEVLDGINTGLKPHMNLKAAKTSCKENYVNADPSNTECMAALQVIKRCVDDLYTNSILEPKCTFAIPKLNTEANRRSLEEGPENFLLSPPKVVELWCRNFNYALAYIWANDDTVQDALHVRKGIVSDWKRCNETLSYTNDILSVVDVHRSLSKADLQVLVESGNRDLVIPYIGTEKWIKSLNLTIINDWRPWLVDGQVAGYTRKYSENGFRLTYATIKGQVIQCRSITEKNVTTCFKDGSIIILSNVFTSLFHIFFFIILVSSDIVCTDHAKVLFTSKSSN